MRVNAQQRHIQAMLVPSSKEEIALTRIVRGLEAYVELLEDGQELEQHAQLMATVVNMTRAALALTGGPLGRLDGALLQQKLGEIAGIDLDSSTVVQLHDSESDLTQSPVGRHPAHDFVLVRDSG